MPRGPAPTPTPVLKLRGSWRAKDRQGEPAFDAGLGTCPAWLSAVGKAEWKRVVEQLGRANLGQQCDRAALVAYCEAWGEFVQLRADVDGLRRELGSDRLSLLAAEGLLKLVRLKNAASDRMMKAAAQFGFTPAARARVKAAEKPNDADQSGKARFFRKPG